MAASTSTITTSVSSPHETKTTAAKISEIESQIALIKEKKNRIIEEQIKPLEKQSHELYLQLRTLEDIKEEEKWTEKPGRTGRTSYLLTYIKKNYETKIYDEIMTKLGLSDNGQQAKDERGPDYDGVYVCSSCKATAKTDERCSYYYIGFGHYLCFRDWQNGVGICMWNLLKLLSNNYQIKIPRRIRKAEEYDPD